jgi:hypothetical protein
MVHLILIVEFNFVKMLLEDASPADCVQAKAELQAMTQDLWLRSYTALHRWHGRPHLRVSRQDGKAEPLRLESPHQQASRPYERRRICIARAGQLYVQSVDDADSRFLIHSTHRTVGGLHIHDILVLQSIEESIYHVSIRSASQYRTHPPSLPSVKLRSMVCLGCP